MSFKEERKKIRNVDDSIKILVIFKDYIVLLNTPRKIVSSSLSQYFGPI